MAKPKTMETRKLVSFPAGLARAVEDFRYTNRRKGRDGKFRRDVGDGEHAEVVIAERVYRVRIAELGSPIG